MTTILAPHHLDRLGVDLGQGTAMDIDFVMLRPIGLRLSSNEDDGSDQLEWEGFSLERDSNPDERCVWDFVELAHSEDPQDCLEFVEQWGLPSSGIDDEIDLSRPDRPGAMSVVEWQSESSLTERALLALIATSEGELVPTEELLAIGGGQPLYIRTPEEEGHRSAGPEGGAP